MPYKNPEDAKARARRYYQENKDRWKNSDGSWKMYQTPERKKASSRKHIYKTLGNTEVTLDEITGRMIGVCPICERGPQALVYDHCHTSKQFRDWICNDCNLMLGFAKDNPITLQRGMRYMEEHNGRG